MAEYVTKGQALQALEKSESLNTGFSRLILFGLFSLELASIPTADVAPVVQGEWIGVEGDGYIEDENGETQIVYNVFECSNCGCEHRADGEPEWTYCPDCGARMDGKQ